MNNIKKIIRQYLNESSILPITNMFKTTMDLFGNKINGRILNKRESEELEKEIESNYADNVYQLLRNEKDDIRTKLFNYDNPIAEKTINGVNLRIAEGLIRNKQKTYLLYANGKIVGEFYSINDIKKIVKYIEDNLIEPQKSIDIVNEAILPVSLRNMSLLYHSTSFKNLMQILKYNALYGSEFYDYGIATSRNRNYLFHMSEEGVLKSGEGECQLILDRDKIKNNYKIKAFDWEEFKLIDDINYHQSEDKILTDKITNIKKYIVGIHLNKNVRKNLKELLEKYGDFIDDNDIVIFDKDWDVIYS